MHKNDNVALRDLKRGGKIMHKLYFVRNKVQLITSNISRLIRVFDMLLFCVTLYDYSFIYRVSKKLLLFDQA